MLFDRVADVYQRARPPYPRQLFDRLGELGVLRPGARLLEIGAGTGQATEELLRAGAHVDAIEPGTALAERLRARLPTVTVRTETVENAELAESHYDAVVCATAFHWVDVPTTLPRLHAALRPGGLLAVWWTVFGDPGHRSPFRDRVDAIASRRDGPRGVSSGPLDTASWLGSLTEHGWFEPVHTEQFRWPVDLTPAQVHDLFSTFNGWTGDEIDEVAAAARECAGAAGVVTERYVTALYVCRRRH